LACSGYLSEPPAPFCRNGADIVANQNHHGRGSLLPQERRVSVEVTAQVPGQELGLQIW
jgi:hypothetical protein